MHNSPLFRQIIFFVVLCFSMEACAWGTKAHLVIGMLAKQRLTPAARASVENILAGEDLASATIWADEMRQSQDKPEFWTRYAATWHYVNIPPGADYASAPKNPRGDAYDAMQTFAAILLDEPVPVGPVREGLEFYFDHFDARSVAVKRFALKFMLHIIGDLQQPLHSGYESDRGGNEINVTWFGQATNLHALWDSQLLDRQQRSAEQIARRLGERVGHTPASDVRNMESADPLMWITESQRILERMYASHSSSTDLSDTYAAQFVPTVETQLVKGGLRTAYFLNSIFGGWPIASR